MYIRRVYSIYIHTRERALSYIYIYTNNVFFIIIPLYKGRYVRFKKKKKIKFCSSTLDFGSPRPVMLCGIEYKLNTHTSARAAEQEAIL